MSEYSISPLKRCTQCGDYHPPTVKFWYINRSQKSGLNARCKKCMKQYRASPKGQSVLKKYNDSSKARTRMKVFYSTPEQQQKRKDRYQSSGKERQRERERNPEVRAKIREYQRTDKMRMIFKIHGEKRRAKELSLPDTFTKADWFNALEYFHNCCAVCGKQLNSLLGTHKAAMDHWIPIVSPKCPGTIPENIIPLCHGQDGCNNSKHSSEPFEWLQKKFGKRKAKTIMNNISNYFESLKLKAVK